MVGLGLIGSVSLLIIGLIIIVMLEFIRGWTLSRKAGPKKRGISSTNRIALEISGPAEQVWSLCEDTVELYKNGAIAQTNKKKGELMIYTRLSKHGIWKDNIRFELDSIDELRTKVTITSWPEKYEPLDFGRNLKNIVIIVGYLCEKTDLNVLHVENNVYA